MKGVDQQHAWAGMVALLAVVVGGTACVGDGQAEEAVEPAVVEEVAGSDSPRITLTRQAATRLAIETAVVTEVDGHVTVPGGALVVDPDGAYWVYVSPTPLVFVPHQVRVDHEDDDGVAHLTEGPPTGTEVVVLGAAELYGVEHGIGH